MVNWLKQASAGDVLAPAPASLVQLASKAGQNKIASSKGLF
jgi:hypothetical protein